MPLLILLVFIAVPIAEIALLLKVGEYIGWLSTIAIVILTAVIGTSLLRHQGFGVLGRASQALEDGKMPVEQVIEGICLLLAGAFLLTPGLITDTVGFLLLIPFIRRAVAHWTLQRLLKSGSIHVTGFGRRRGSGGSRPLGDDDFSAGGAQPGPAGKQRAGLDEDGPIIDGEFERMDERTARGRRDGKDS